jgi:hypothetical protein
MNRRWNIETEERGEWLVYFIYDHQQHCKWEAWIKWTARSTHPTLTEIMSDHERQSRLAESNGTFPQAKN